MLADDIWSLKCGKRKSEGAREDMKGREHGEQYAACSKLPIPVPWKARLKSCLAGSLSKFSVVYPIGCEMLFSPSAPKPVFPPTCDADPDPIR